MTDNLYLIISNFDFVHFVSLNIPHDTSAEIVKIKLMKYPIGW